MLFLTALFPTSETNMVVTSTSILYSESYIASAFCLVLFWVSVVFCFVLFFWGGEGEVSG